MYPVVLTNVHKARTRGGRRRKMQSRKEDCTKDWKVAASERRGFCRLVMEYVFPATGSSYRLCCPVSARKPAARWQAGTRFGSRQNLLRVALWRCPRFVWQQQQTPPARRRVVEGDDNKKGSHSFSRARRVYRRVHETEASMKRICSNSILYPYSRLKHDRNTPAVL